jgi:protocatechuate 3,4-dioxygenase beta subunit
MHQTRRTFIGSLPALAIAFPELSLVRLKPDSTAAAAAADPGRMTVAPAGEPGQRLLVTGTIVGTDGKTPLPNMRLSVYHTDNDGYYSRPVDDSRNARLRGTLVTDASGRYEIRTIWPGHYPGGGNPRHIHVHLAGPDVPEHWIDSFLFEGDKYLGAAEARRSGDLGTRFAYVMSMTRGEDGLIRCARDIRLDRATAERNRLVDGWYRNGEGP